MTTRAKSIRSGLAWIVLSPIALLMALISTVGSDITYYVQIGLFGVWSTCGVISGIGKLANATWANRLQIVLAWIGFTYFAFCGVLIALYSIVAMFKSSSGAWGLTLLLAVAVCLSSVPFYLLAKKRKGNAEKQ